MKRFAFTMLELVFIIIVIGIIAVLAMPSFNSNPLQQAAEQVANHIRYTQHLAMVDDKFDASDSLWFRENWQIQFTSTPSNVFYTVYSDTDHLGNADDNGTAIDPLTRDKLTVDLLNHTSNRTNLKEKFGITDVSFSSTCNGDGTGKELSFDVLGRPYHYITSTLPPASNMFQYLLTQPCNITLTHPSGTAVINVQPETGYVSVTYP
jgi:Tfp pilus assembly protein FimT